MSESKQLDAETMLAADHDGSYRAHLMEALEKHRDAIAFQRQGFLPPDEYQVVEHIFRAVDAALVVVGAYQPERDVGLPDDSPMDEPFTPMINI